MSKTIEITRCAFCDDIKDLGHGEFQCDRKKRKLPDDLTIPSWCPLPDSKGDIAAIIGEIANNQEMFISGGPLRSWIGMRESSARKETRFKIELVGPERILKQLVDLIWNYPQENNHE